MSRPSNISRRGFLRGLGISLMTIPLLRLRPRVFRPEEWRIRTYCGVHLLDERILTLDAPVKFELARPHRPTAVAEFDPAMFLRGRNKPRIEVIHPKSISEGKSVDRDRKVQSSGVIYKMPKGVIKLRLDYTSLDDA